MATIAVYNIFEQKLQVVLSGCQQKGTRTIALEEYYGECREEGVSNSREFAKNYHR
jgi:hypothetical protein